MKEKYYWISIILLSIFCLIGNIALIKEKSQKKQNLLILTSQTEKIDFLKNHLSLSFELALDSIFDGNDIIDELHNNSDKVILYISDQTCAGCVQSIILDLDLLSETIGYKNILIIGSLDNEDKFWNIIGTSPELFTCYNSPALKITKDFNSSPAVFVLNPTKHIELLYIKDIYPEYNHEYFTRILPNYFQQD